MPQFSTRRSIIFYYMVDYIFSRLVPVGAKGLKIGEADRRQGNGETLRLFVSIREWNGRPEAWIFKARESSWEWKCSRPDAQRLQKILLVGWPSGARLM